MKTIVCVAATVVLSVSSGEIAFSDPTYHVTRLGFGFTNGIEAKINNCGQIVGSDGQKGFIYDAGYMTTLGTLGGPVFGTRPHAINDKGQIAGFSLTASYEKHGFLYTNGSFEDLGALPGYPASTAFGINDTGDVVGAYYSPDGTSSLAFLYSNGSFTDLGSGVATAINASGTVIGTSTTIGSFRYEDGLWTNLGAVGPEDINDQGQIAGSAYVPVGNGSYTAHPFLYESGVWRDLGLPTGVPLGIPSAINNIGQIVGNSNQSLGASDRPPFLYTGGTIYNLQSLLDSSGVGVSLQLAYDINDSGVILAEGNTSFGYEAVLLTPVPEPSSLMLFGAAAAFIAGLRWWRRRS